MLAELLQQLRDDPAANEWTLIRAARDERGIIAGLFTEGQVALARWLMTVDRVGVAHGAINFLTSPLGARDTLRQLSGESEPCEMVANQMAEWSEGAIRPAMWARPIDPPAQMPAATASHLAVAGEGGRAVAPQSRPPVDIRISERLALSRKDNGALLIRTASFVATIDEADLAPLSAGLDVMLGRREAVAA